jgi:hypothetical protein
MGPIFKTISLLFLSTLSHLTHATTQADFTGTGQILVLNSSDWSIASPAQTVGCLDNTGRISVVGSACGTFTRLPVYPYTLSSKSGNCTFNDVNAPKNTDSVYGGNGYAWSCMEGVADIYDELYTVVRIRIPFTSSDYIVRYGIGVN